EAAAAEETDRTLFIRNLDTRVTEELLFELFLQAGPLIKTKIPKDADGKQKTFGFAVYKHEVSVPYAMELLNGTSLYGRTIHVQFRSGEWTSVFLAGEQIYLPPHPLFLSSFDIYCIHFCTCSCHGPP
uniref:RNA binding motif protein 7 n=1 Tax=Stegastes partitus TaxID=144197 RepID=A0A3B5BGJ4_9TELE